MGDEAYSKVSSCEVGLEEDVINGMLPMPRSSFSSFCQWRIPVVAAILVVVSSFGAGFMVATTWLPAEPCRVGSGRVSYDFLESPKGKELQSTLESRWRQNGPVSALQHMEGIMERDAQAASSCHPFLHQLGRMAWREGNSQNSTDSTSGVLEAASAFLNNPSTQELMGTCNAAYMHGLIEESLKNTEDETKLSQQALSIQDKICNKFDNETYKIGAWECQHGVGHGILQHQRVVLQQQALDRALELCHHSFPDSPRATGACQNGVWMDYWVYQGMNTLDMDFEHGDEDPLAVCLGAQQSHHSYHYDPYPCVAYAPTAYLLRHPQQYKDAMEIFCRGGNDVCYQGVGMQAAKEHMQDLVPVEQACLAAPTVAAQEWCFNQAVGYHKMFMKSLPKVLCNRLATFKQLCLDHVLN